MASKSFIVDNIMFPVPVPVHPQIVQMINLGRTNINPMHMFESKDEYADFQDVDNDQDVHNYFSSQVIRLCLLLTD
mgnify:CR=1 FL=1